MPDTDRATEGRHRAHPRRSGFRFAVAATAFVAQTLSARAEIPVLRPLEPYIGAVASSDRQEFAALVLTLGMVLFAAVSAILLVRARLRAAAAEARFREHISSLKAECDRCNALLQSEPQILVSWAAADNEPDIIGDTALVTSSTLPQRVLAFGTWLETDKAQTMERAVDALRASGESFSMQLMTRDGRAIEADGRAIGGLAVLRLRDVSGLKRELAELNARHDKLVGDVESLRALI
jgi:hypothetical protein